MSKYDHLLKELTGITIFEVVRYLFVSLLLAVASYVGANASTSTFLALAPYKWPIAIALFAAAALASMGLVRRLSRWRPRFPALDPDFHIVESRILFEYSNPSKVTYKKSYRLRAMRQGLDEFVDKYHWTGSGKCALRSGKEDHQVRLTRQKNVWQLFSVTFPKSLNRGEEIDTEVIWDLDDIDGKAVPFISSTIHDPTDKLVLSVRLAPVLGVKKVTCEHAVDIGAHKVINSTQLELRDDFAEWTVEQPDLLHHYEMRWSPRPEAK